MKRLVVGVLFSVFLASCATDEFDRESARDALVRAIGKKDGGPPVTDIRSVWIFWFVKKDKIQNLREIGFLDGSGKTPLLKKYTHYLENIKEGSPVPDYFRDYLIINPRLMNVKKESLEFEVTGVSLQSESQAEVIFNWQKAPLPEFWDSIIIGEGEGHAVAQKFDDGWRITQVEFTRASERKLRNKKLESFHRQVVARCALSASGDWPWGQADYMEEAHWNDPTKLTLLEGKIFPGCQ